MTDRNYEVFADDCPDCIMFVARGKSVEILAWCGNAIADFDLFSDAKESEWDVPVDGLYVADVDVATWQTWTDYGYEYDAAWSPHNIRPIDDTMWDLFVADEPIWPDEYYASIDDDG